MDAKIQSLDKQLRGLQQRIEGVKLCFSALKSYTKLNPDGNETGHRSDYAADQLRETASSLVEQARLFAGAVEELFNRSSE